MLTRPPILIRDGVMASDWVRVRKDIWVRQLPDGTVEGVRKENIRRSLDVKAEMRRESKKAHRRKDGLRLVASYPVTVAMEMDEKCKHDPDKEAMFLRDHPEHLVEERRRVRLPKSTAYCFPRHMKPQTRGRS